MDQVDGHRQWDVVADPLARKREWDEQMQAEQITLGLMDVRAERLDAHARHLSPLAK